MFILIIGLPNSGKTTYSNIYNNVVHFDNLQGHSIQKFNQAIDITKNNNNIILEGVYSLRKQRIELLQNIDVNIKKICVWINTPYEICVERAKNCRPKIFVDAHYKVFQPPTYDEGWDEIIVLQNCYL